ncbi:MAG: hypothetical protein WKF87_09070 [Chryseolinea sp.]
MISKRQTEIPVSVLWSYREFKRDEVPAPRFPFMHMHSVAEIKDDIQVNGLEPLELSIIKHTALLTDGNHRIVAARQLGYGMVPVEIVVYFGSGADTFYEHTLNRFKPIDKRLEEILRRVFFKSDVSDNNIIQALYPLHALALGLLLLSILK